MGEAHALLLLFVLKSRLTLASTALVLHLLSLIMHDILQLSLQILAHIKAHKPMLGVNYP